MRSFATNCLPLIVLALPAFAQTRPVIHRLDGTILSAAQAREIAAAELSANHVTGAELTILNEGQVVWTDAFGLRNVEKQLPMTPDTNLWAASITKSLFATWVMQLVEQHRINLDEPLAQMLERPLNEYKSYRDSASELVKDPRWPKVTVRMLLDHTSGFANLMVLEPDRKLHLHFDPGSRFAYSGDGMNLLQFAIEEKLREPLDVSMQRDIFSPLRMDRTGMVWRPEFDENAALRYDSNGKLIGATHRTAPRGAGSMATTIRDLSRFTEAFLDNRILQPSTRAQMLAPQIAIHDAHQFPTLAFEAGAGGDKVGLAYGLGWGLLTHTRYGPAFFKEGHGDGAENYLICFTRGGTCIILLTNSDNGELAFRPLLEKLIGDNVTPWEWEGYTREEILRNEEHSRSK